MKGLQVFENGDFGEIRIVEIDGKMYFVGVDVARALEYANPSKAILDHCKGISKLDIPSSGKRDGFLTWELIDSLGRKQETNIISEGDVYRLIIKAADQSRSEKVKAKAKQFESWVFDEILPTIRKTGSYAIGEPDIAKLAVVTRFIREMRLIMEKQICAPSDIAYAANDILRKSGLPLPCRFIKENPFEQLSLAAKQI